MTWIDDHKRSELHAAAAHDAYAKGNMDAARRAFSLAAEAEERALNQLDGTALRTIGIIGVSATALWYKSGNLDQAAALAHQVSVKPSLPLFAVEQLRELLQSIWNEQAQRESGVTFVPGQVVVSVKGGEVVTGGAPLDLILNKVEGIQRLFYRTAEFLMDQPLRTSGLPSKAIQERCRPWLFQTVPGSYQFIVAIQKPKQLEMFSTDDPEPEILTQTFLTILKAAGDESGEALKEVVPDEGYRQTFLKMTRNLAPTGKTFDQLDIRDSNDRTTVSLSPTLRRTISDTLRGPKAIASTSAPAIETTLRGILRALSLDSDWLEVSVDGQLHRISKVGETVDDIIGPMVNHEVLVRVREVKPNTYHFIDIELFE